MGNLYPIDLWNFNDIITKDENTINQFHLTNNLYENINRFLNSNLKRGVCSNFLFRYSILSLIGQFETKCFNENNNNKKSSILTFYIKKIENPKVLNSDEIISLNTYYNDIKFNNINKDYIELDEGDIDVINYNNDDEEQN